MNDTRPGPATDGPDNHPGDAGLRRRCWLSAALLLLFTLGSVALLPGITINNVPAVYLPADAEAVVIDRQLRELFPNDQGMVLLFETPDLFSDRFLDELDELTESLASHPDIEKVASVTAQDHIEGSEDGFAVETLLSPDRVAALDIEQRRARALGDRFAHRTLVAHDASALALVVIPRSLDDSFARMAIQDEVLGLVERQGLAPYLTAEAGHITTDVEQMRESISQNLRFIPFVVIIGLGMIWLLFRRWMAVVVSGLVMATTVSTSLALFVLFDQPFNLISSILPPLLTALTIAALVHLFNGLHYACRRGLEGPARVAATLAAVRKPALYTALTTMAGFASLGLSDIPPIAALGLVVAAGVGFIYLVVFHLVPHLFAYLDRKPWSGGQLKLGFLDRFVGLFFHFGMRRPVLTLVGGVGLLVACAPLLGNIVVETNLLEFFDRDHKTRIATERIQDKLSGTGSLDIVFRGREVQDLSGPETLKSIRAFQRWAEARPQVDMSRSFADFVEEMHWGFHAQEAAYRRIPDNPALISQYLFIYDGTDLYDFVDDSLSTARVSLSINVHGAREINAFLAELRAYLADHAPAGVDWEIAGISRMFADQVYLLVEGQVKSILGALVIIFGLMILQWRSLKDSLICMVPNLSPILLIFILMGAFNIWLDVATAMIASVAVGIAIDDTIHVYHGFIARVRRGISPTLALARTFRQAGRAIMTTTLILCSQFAVLASSSFIPVKHFGLLTSTGLMAALIFDLLLLPAILILVYRPVNSAQSG